MSLTVDQLDWVQAQSTAHIFDWTINEVRTVNVQDKEIRSLIDVGLLVVVDEETRKLLPPPAVITPGISGCNCGR